ncbi:hypothetical protein TNCV_1764771 [Trichonephila clavipes]|nr:hypothetical protein TNCV_1764771 [Trichonephila clavipes]
MPVDNTVVSFLGWATLTSSAGLYPVRGSQNLTSRLPTKLPIYGKLVFRAVIKIQLDVVSQANGWDNGIRTTQPVEEFL